MAEIKYDIKRGADIYREIYIPRLGRWITSGKIKRGEILVWRSGLSGWRKAEELEELAPFFEKWDRLQLRMKKRERPQRTLLPYKKRIKNILIIDNEKDLCSVLQEVLTHKKYNVAIANTGREAMGYMRKDRPDLVFLDLRLPDSDGLKLLPKIKKVHPRTIVNIISAYGSEESREEAREKGAYDFIDKPFTENDILKSIRSLNK